MNKIALVTGASRGIGRETALLMSKNGYTVAVNYNNSKEMAENLVTEIKQSGNDAFAIKADVSVYNEVNCMVDFIINNYGKIDVLVNNAGISKQILFTDIKELQWDKMFDVNVKGVFNCCSCVVPSMISRKYGKIINISSIWGLTGASCEVHYSASKAAVIGFTKALAKELGPSGINVNCIAPGVILTDMNSMLDECTINELKSETPLRSIGSAIDVANAVLFLADDKSSFITGQVISPNGGYVI